ncbi:hypothetical protein ACQ4WX_39925 [Streptomyces lasalocidi]
MSATLRAERLALLERFIEAADAERSAFSRPPEFNDTHAWYLKTQDIMGRGAAHPHPVTRLLHDAARVLSRPQPDRVGRLARW